MTREGCDLRDGGAGERRADDRRAAQIVEGEILGDLGLIECLPRKLTPCSVPNNHQRHPLNWVPVGTAGKSVLKQEAFRGPERQRD